MEAANRPEQRRDRDLIHADDRDERPGNHVSESWLPGAIAEGRTLTVALPKRMGRGDLFEPPPYWQPAGGAALVQLENDIRAVLKMADTVIKLDFFAAGRQRDAARASTSA